MRIVIITGCFYPQVHPRAFRATELAKEFVRKGHIVKIINLTTVDGFDYDSYSKANDFKIINLNINKSNIENNIQDLSKFNQSFFGRFLRFLVDYLLHGRFFYQAKLIVNQLHYVKGADFVIALSTPFVCLYALSKYIRNEGKSFIAIADSGDPFYYSKQTKRAIWFKYIERKTYKYFDYLTIPTKNAINLYSPLIPVEKIKIIPQGFNMRDLELYTGEFNAPVRFAYAGVFYWDIRNPDFLFNYLNRVNIDFEFFIYLRYKDPFVISLLDNYSQLKAKVKINHSLPHDKLIYELSKMHFLVNIENISNTQMPSKLIDYAMTKRPIFSCSKSSFSEYKFEKFLNGEYEDSYYINVDEYNIETIVNKFLELFNSY